MNGVTLPFPHTPSWSAQEQLYMCVSELVPCIQQSTIFFCKMFYYYRVLFLSLVAITKKNVLHVWIWLSTCVECLFNKNTVDFGLSTVHTYLLHLLKKTDEISQVRDVTM